MDKLIAALIATTVSLGSAGLAGCNTVEGAGKDVERAGEKVQEANCTKEDARTDPNCNK